MSADSKSCEFVIDSTGTIVVTDGWSNDLFLSQKCFVGVYN
jgi:hypothetical protein